jgi:hypothetical protein
MIDQTFLWKNFYPIISDRIFFFQWSGFQNDEKGRSSPLFDCEARGGDGFTLAERTAAGGVQAVPFFEKKAASIASCRFHNKAASMPGSGNMLKMIQSFFFTDSEHLGNFPQIETCVAQGFGNFLPQCERLLFE